MSFRQTLEAKKLFVFTEVSVLAWGASVQRANIYKKEVTTDCKRAFRQAVLQEIDEILCAYINGCDEDNHKKNIIHLSNFGTNHGREILADNVYRIGVAQKLLNLLLKYLWCLGHIKKPPPHCPVDRIILSQTDQRGKINWTQITTIDEYETAICSIKKVAELENKDIAEWELDVFSRRGD